PFHFALSNRQHIARLLKCKTIFQNICLEKASLNIGWLYYSSCSSFASVFSFSEHFSKNSCVKSSGQTSYLSPYCLFIAATILLPIPIFREEGLTDMCCTTTFNSSAILSPMAPTISSASFHKYRCQLGLL